jgi:hypothetical protein
LWAKRKKELRMQKRLKKLQKFRLFIDDKYQDTTMITGHQKKQKFDESTWLVWKEG